MEPTWTTIAQARADLRIPVAGIIPPELGGQPTPLRHYGPAVRAAVIFGGLLLMVVCTGVAVVAFCG